MKTVYKPTNRESGLEEVHKEAAKKKECCNGRKCWMVIAIIAILLLLMSVGGIAGLMSLLLNATRPIEVIKQIEGCSKCPSCYSCLAGFTGQRVDQICEVKDLSVVLQCTGQILYIYSRPNNENSIPCYDQCRPCSKCIDKLALKSLDLTTTLWQTVFAQFFHGPSDVSDFGNDCELDCTASMNCTWVCPNTESGSVARRRKRVVMNDGDACCRTQREQLPFVNSYTDLSGDIWYPVWFRQTWASPEYSFQVYDEITCPVANPSCDRSLFCTPKTETRSFLMSRDVPNVSYGYTYIFLTYPNTNAQFIDIEVDCYCQCNN